MYRNYIRLLSQWQNTWNKRLEGGKIYFSSLFQRFQSILAEMAGIAQQLNSGREEEYEKSGYVRRL
jgi:hypothetical protein